VNSPGAVPFCSVEHRIHLDLHAQPDDVTCGPTCLHAVYRYLGLDLPLETVIEEIATLDDGGTLAVFLGINALRRGFRARIHTFNLKVFDPTWFDGPRRIADPVHLAERLRAQRTVKHSRKLRVATDAYLEFLALGGEIASEDLTAELIRRHLRKGIPLLTGLSATWLYNCAREVEESATTLRHDDVEGVPTGHFVVVCGLGSDAGEALVADPLSQEPGRRGRLYAVPMARLVCAILIGTLTYDGNLLSIRASPGAG